MENFVQNWHKNGLKMQKINQNLWKNVEKWVKINLKSLEIVENRRKFAKN